MHGAAGPSGQKIERALAVGDRCLDPLGEHQYLAACRRQQHAVAGPLHERQPGQILQLTQLLGDRRLGQTEMG